jgi:hypothetical protein
MRRFAFPLAALVAAACSSHEVDVQQEAVDHAIRAREIVLATRPAIRSQTREQFAADAQQDATTTTDEDIQRQRDTYGRLGFYPRSFDVRASAGAASDFYIAYYSSETKSVTVVGEPEHATLVHELVHALQDQKFDLQHVHGEHLSSDESLARDALVEGDARMAEYRDYLWDRGQDPIRALVDFATVAGAYEDANAIFRKTQLPLLYAAHSAFAYSFGSAFIGNRLGIGGGRWSYAGVDALFVAANGPVSTQEVIRAGEPVDAIERTGLTTLPFDVASAWDVESVDRLGEWYTFVLLYPSAPDKQGLATLTHAWDGDQLLTLRKKDGNDPPSVSSPSGIVWTTIWDDAASAAAFAAQLERTHDFVRRDGETNVGKAAIDDELVWIEQRDRQLCFVKNLPQDVAQTVAHAALYTEDERRYEIKRLAPPASRIVHRPTWSPR